MNHTGIKISRQVTVLHQQLLGAVICQIFFQRMGPVGINQGAPSANLKRYDTNASGNQFPV